MLAPVVLVVVGFTAPPAASPRAAAERALPRLQAAAAGHIEQKSCFACHNQTVPLLAFAAARDRGLSVPAPSFAAQTEHIAAFFGEKVETLRKGEAPGGAADTVGMALYTLELGGHKADETTAAMVEFLLKSQTKEGRWRVSGFRPPTEASSFSTTYFAARGVRVWATADQKERAAKATAAVKAWLPETTAKDTEDRVFRLLLLHELKADPKEVAAASWELLKTQTADGGFAQKGGMAPDAYATGTALVALHRAGGLAADHPAYARGVGFLVRTQRADGTWYVKSRSNPFQPYYESGFPHGKDQFISASASGWATAALLAAP